MNRGPKAAAIDRKDASPGELPELHAGIMEVGWRNILTCPFGIQSEQ